MLGAIGQALPVAVAALVASLSVLPIVLLVITGRNGHADLAFVAGWLAGNLVVAGVVVLVVDVTVPASAPPRWTAVARIVVGVVLLLLALRTWRGRPRDGEVPPTPGWMTAIGSAAPPRAFGVAVLASSVNPKNAVFAVSGASAILDATTVPGEQVVALAVFVVVASAGVIAPVVAARIGGEDARGALDRLTGWAAANSAAVLTLVLVLLAAMMIGNGLDDLDR